MNPTSALMLARSAEEDLRRELERRRRLRDLRMDRSAERITPTEMYRLPRFAPSPSRG